MFGLHPLHLIVIAIVAILIFGPQRLPKLGLELAKAVRDFRGGLKEMNSDVQQTIDAPEKHATPSVNETAQMAPPVPASAPSTRKCPQCNVMGLHDSLFCHKCGQRLTN